MLRHLGPTGSSRSSRIPLLIGSSRATYSWRNSPVLSYSPSIRMRGENSLALLKSASTIWLSMDCRMEPFGRLIREQRGAEEIREEGKKGWIRPRQKLTSWIRRSLTTLNHRLRRNTRNTITKWRRRWRYSRWLSLHCLKRKPSGKEWRKLEIRCLKISTKRSTRWYKSRVKYTNRSRLQAYSWSQRINVPAHPRGAPARSTWTRRKESWSLGARRSPRAFRR